jgi:hypothetical protein
VTGPARAAAGTPRARVWLAVVLGLGAVAVIAAVVASIVVFRSLGALGESNEAPSLSEIETYGHIRLPPDVRDVKARVDLVITKRTLFARFTIDPAELPALLASSRLEAPLTSRDRPTQLDAAFAPAWWAPRRARTWRAGATERAAILVDTSAASGYVVYLIALS